jgi:ubiquinone/menaquinone biosynthesis C-methylase UbiE
MTSAMTRSGYDEMAARYDEGRALPLDRLEGWRRALAGVLSTGGSVRIVDVGSGTGLWSMAFATWFGARVVGVEPSAGMRHQAAEKRPHPRVAYVAGRGDAIPLAGDSCSAAWLSTVVHHFRDPEAAALELRRVLHPDAPVLIREGFTGRTDGIPWLGYFPRRWRSPSSCGRRSTTSLRPSHLRGSGSRRWNRWPRSRPATATSTPIWSASALTRHLCS